MMLFAKAIEQAVRGQPFFAQDQTVGPVAVEQLLEVVDHFVVWSAPAALLNHTRGELPVVIPSAEILPALNFFVRRLVAGEVLYGGLDGGAIGLGHVYEYAVHVEY